jgi:stage V sporulation protein SpoVS
MQENDESVEKLEQDIEIDESEIEKVEASKPLADSLRVAADPKGITEEERKTAVKKLAGAIAHALRAKGKINVRAFGHAAIGKACKALAIAKKYIEKTNKLQLSYSPAFITTQIGETTLTGIVFCTFTEECFNVDMSKVKSILKVKADPKDITAENRRINMRKIAGAISHAVEENKECIVRCFGNASINKTCKALATARGFTATRGPDLYCWNDFIVTEMGDKERTGLSFFCYSNE